MSEATSYPGQGYPCHQCGYLIWAGVSHSCSTGGLTTGGGLPTTAPSGRDATIAALEAQVAALRADLAARALCSCTDCRAQWWAKDGSNMTCPKCASGGTVGYVTFRGILEDRKQLAEKDARIAELEVQLGSKSK